MQLDRLMTLLGLRRTNLIQKSSLWVYQRSAGRSSSALHALHVRHKACPIPVGGMYITGDESEPHTRHWLHPKAPEHLHMTVATSQQYQVLVMKGNTGMTPDVGGAMSGNAV